MLSQRSWYPPCSLTGSYWRLEILHIDKSWRWYTEHLIYSDAQRMLSIRQSNSACNQWRIVKAFR